MTISPSFVSFRKTGTLPRLPLEGNFDLTYRCNNHCRHCWLWVAPDAVQPKDELSFDEIKKIAEDARRMGCQEWSMSGGEPMLRPDFEEIFEVLTARARTYSLNTNGTLITPKIAQLLRRSGKKMVALYGATPEVHDHITRTPGSFEATLRGCRYLQEAGASFTVQLIPLKDNYHQFEQMRALAASLSRHFRIGVDWIKLSACCDPRVNQEIMAQRLPPCEVVALDPPFMHSAREELGDKGSSACGCQKGDHLFASCIERSDFHMDPYGGMTFCRYIKDSSMRYDLRHGNFREAWDEFIPSLASKIPISDVHRQQCGACTLRVHCRICPAHAYLEHGDFQGRVDYLCAVAQEEKLFKENWLKNHRRYFQIADITLEIHSDIPFKKDSFVEAIRKFEVKVPGDDTIKISHYFELPDMRGKDLGREVYRGAPWAIYRKDDTWIYTENPQPDTGLPLNSVMVFRHDHSRGVIYHSEMHKRSLQKGGAQAVSLVTTDQILIARLLADREGCYLHSCGVNWAGRGYLFAGRSGAGKSTMAQMLAGRVELLCDDRIIVRKKEGEFRIYGTWHHGTEPYVSPGRAPLKGIFFIHQSLENEVRQISEKKEILHRLLPLVIKPLVTVDWWEKTLSIVEDIAVQVPCYDLYCDKSGAIVEVFERL